MEFVEAKLGIIGTIRYIDTGALIMYRIYDTCIIVCE